MSTEETPLYLRKNSYILDANDEVEMARLVFQNYLITRNTDGLSLRPPGSSYTSEIDAILDMACGAGGWVLQMAEKYPETEVMGVDLSIRMLTYARAQALVFGLPNAHFRLMDILQPLDFLDNSFDFVNARFLVGVVPPAAWPALLRECWRITRPGGLIRLTEAEYGISNSYAWEQLSELVTRALHKVGRSFSPDGQHFGITPMLGRFLRDANYKNIQKVAYLIDYSAGAEEHDPLYEEFRITLRQMQPFLIKVGLTTQEEGDRLYQQALVDMRANDFCAVQFLLSVWGEKL